MATVSSSSTAQETFFALLSDALRNGSFVKLTLGGCASADKTLQNVFIRPVTLRAGARLSFVYRHATRDITKNLDHAEGLARLSKMLGNEFRNAHLFTTARSAQLKFRDGREPLLVLGKPSHAAPVSTRHDRDKQRILSLEGAPWLHALGVTTATGKVMKGMEAKFRQIHKFVELLQHLLTEAGLRPPTQPGSSRRKEAHSSPARDQSLLTSAATDSLTLVDMGCGKGYLTFAAYECLRNAGWDEAQVRGIEARPELVELCNRAARENGFDRLRFEAGDIAGATLDRINVLAALHACDTATDDAIARGIEAGASLILVSPCCHKELRPRLRPPPVLAGAFKHGILRERQAEFVTDALRAALLEWAGYDTKVFEFISTEHTSKNLMIAAMKRKHIGNRDELERGVRELAAFYGITSQRLAAHLRLSLAGKESSA